MKIVNRVIAIILLSLMISVSWSMYDSAYAAGGGGGGGSGGPSAAAGDRFHWNFYGSPDAQKIVYRCQGSSYGNANGHDESLEEYTDNQRGIDGEYGAGWIAYVTTHSGWDDNGECFIYDTHGAANWDAIGNWGTNGNDFPDYLIQDFNSKMNDAGYPQYATLRNVYGIMWGPDTIHGNANTMLSCAWDAAGGWEEYEDTSTSGDLIKVWDDRGNTFLDNSNKKSKTKSKYGAGNDAHAEFVYFDNTEKVKYTGNTKPEELTSMTTNVHYIVEKATETYKYELRSIYDSEGNKIGEEKRNEEWTYTLTSHVEKKKKLTWKLTGTTIKQIKYKPYNLNRGGLVDPSDIGSGFGNAEQSLNATAETIDRYIDPSGNEVLLPKKTDNSPIAALDVNADVPFKFEFGNKTFGLPDDIDWATAPKDINPDPGETVKSGSTYCNGKYSKNVIDGVHRYNTTFYASTTSLSAVENTSSLLIGDEETRSNDDPFKWVYTKNNEFTGSEGWSFRSNLFGDYTTDHSNDGKGQYPKWWLIEYDALRYYEYGVKWEGYVTQSKVEAPTWKWAGGTLQEGKYKFTQNANHANQTRGLYINKTTAHYYQPVLYAKWNVKTLAGDVIGL